MWRTAMVSPRFGSSMTTGRLTTAPGPRIATCGLLMIGVSHRAPKLPRLVIVKVPPDSSSGPILLVRVRWAKSAIFFARPATDRSPASLTTGVSRPFSVSTANATCSRSKYVTSPASVSIVALSDGCCLSASIAALAKNGRYVSFTPSRARKSAFRLSRMRAMLVTSTSTTWVSWAEVWRESTIRSAMILRRREIFSVLPRSGDGRGRRLAGVEHVLLADAAPDAGALHRRQVDAVLGRELADQRGHVAGAVGLGRRGSGLGSGLGG